MNAWFDILGLTPTSKEDEEGIKKSSHALSTWLPLHARFPQELANFDGKLKTPIIQCHGDADPMVILINT